MSPRPWAICYLPQVMSEIIFFSEIRIVEEVNSPSFLLAERLSFCHTGRRFGSFLISELVKSLIYHLTGKLIYFSSIPRILCIKTTQERRTSLPHLVVVLIHPISKGLDASVFLSSRTIVKTEVNLAQLGERKAWRILIFVHIIVAIHIECVDESMLSRAYFIYIRSISHYLWDTTSLVLAELSCISSIKHDI